LAFVRVPAEAKLIKAFATEAHTPIHGADAPQTGYVTGGWWEGEVVWCIRFHIQC